jgi:nucleotide-binding universal stress UspA family protein
MAKRILVPLDEATQHEAVLPLVADAARTAGATVRLLHVAPPPDNVVNDDGFIVAYADQQASNETTHWLDRLARFYEVLQGVPVERVVRFGKPTEEILAEADAFGADLIAVTTVTRASLARGLLGSVAEQLMKRSPVPVLLLRAG